MLSNATPNYTVAHRYLADGRIEFICVSCLSSICTVSHEEDAITQLRVHTCPTVEPEKQTVVGESRLDGLLQRPVLSQRTRWNDIARRHRLSRLKLWSGVLALLVCGQLAATVLVPRGFFLTLVTDVITVLLMSSALFVFLTNAKATSSQTTKFWTLVAACWAITAVGQILWMYFDLVLRKEVPNPFVGDILLFLSNVPFLAALFLQPNLSPPKGPKQQKYVDFALLLLWWL
jgi:hypothetical protein